MFIRALLTVLLLGVWYVVQFYYHTEGTLQLGQVAGQQFQPSDTAYLNTMVLFRAFQGGWLWVSLVFLFLLGVLWYVPARGWFKHLMQVLSVIVLLTLLPFPAQAYYDKTDYTEAYTILPNESAFWIPDAGDNKNNQAQLLSEDYLQANKVAAKRFIIPHAKLSGSGSFFDFYVPAGRLIIVDRTPYSKEWVASPTRGTSKQDEGFPCQTKEGLNITAGVSIGTSVKEESAAKFLYRFGVHSPEGKRADPAIIFQSVYYGRSLSDVMDDVGRKKVQTLVCEQIASRTFDQANADTNPIMMAVSKGAQDWFATVGITVEFIGWADTFTFDKDVQAAVNDAYKAAKLGPVIGVLQATTQLEVQRGLGSGLDKHGLPIVVTPDMLNAIIGMGRALTTGGK